jgi:hypothetical protein
VEFAEAADAENFRLLRLWVTALDHEHHLAVVVDEADSAQALVRDASVELQRREVAEIDAAFGERLVELHHQRLVFGTNRSNRDGGSVPQLQGVMYPNA